jgi:hypothetical protein
LGGKGQRLERKTRGVRTESLQRGWVVSERRAVFGEREKTRESERK